MCVAITTTRCGVVVVNVMAVAAGCVVIFESRKTAFVHVSSKNSAWWWWHDK